MGSPGTFLGSVCGGAPTKGSVWCGVRLSLARGDAESSGTTEASPDCCVLPVPFFPFFPQSCHLQKLFGTDGELEDEVRDPPKAWGARWARRGLP